MHVTQHGGRLQQKRGQKYWVELQVDTFSLINITLQKCIAEQRISFNVYVRAVRLRL
jgi:hypothetical protein